MVDQSKFIENPGTLPCLLKSLVDGYVPQVRNVSGSGTFRFLIFAEPRLPNRCAVRQNPRFKNKYSSTFHILNFTIQPVPTFHVLLLLQVLLKYFLSLCTK